MATTSYTPEPTPRQTHQGTDGLRLRAPIAHVPGGFWRRLVAVIVDGAIVSVITMPLNVVFGALMGYGATLTADELQTSGGLLALTYGGSYLISLLTIFFYYGWFYKTKGATPGKMLLGLRVSTFDTGMNVSYWRAFSRETLGKFVSSLLLGIGFLMIAFRSDKRGLHDLLCNTHVTYEPK